MSEYKTNIHLRFENFKIENKDYSPMEQGYLNKELLSNKSMYTHCGFGFSQVIESMIYWQKKHPNEEQFKLLSITDAAESGYIIPMPVQYHPADWTNYDSSNVYNEGKKSVFDLLNPIYLRDLQIGKAILLIDQSVEGYSAEWLWDWFHVKCKQYNISPRAIIYLTGDQSCTDQYNMWCNVNNQQDKILVISSTSLAMYINAYYTEKTSRVIQDESKFDDILSYKSKHKDSLYLYDCLNMRPRPQRIINYLHLKKAGLIHKGNISMPSTDTWKSHIDISADGFFSKFGLSNEDANAIGAHGQLNAKYSESPKTGHYYSYVERILNEVYKNSWVSLVTESSFFNFENNVFISEKTFKPIAAMQPFMIVGSKFSLRYLRKLGYKTFSPFIDETYDILPDENRFLAIIQSLKKIDQVEDKVSWLNGMRDILEYNFNRFMQIGISKSSEHEKISNYYFDYFKDRN